VRTASAGLVVRLVRWTLPLALLAATLVAVLGLGGIVLSAPPEPRPTPEVALNLTRAPAMSVADEGLPAPLGAPRPAPSAPTRPDCAPPPVCGPVDAAAAPVERICCP
jgi:hypothetical protein